MRPTKNKWLIIAVGVIALLFLYQAHPGLRLLTVLSVSRVYVDPKGYEDPNTHEWKGSYWVILMTADMSDQIATYKFSSETSDDYQGDTIEGKKLIPESEIVIKIDPEESYYQRPLETRTYQVYPKTYGTWVNRVTHQVGKDSGVVIDALSANTLEFGASYWSKYTPFRVTVLKNGEVVGSQVMNTEGGAKDAVISTDEGSVLVKNLGYLGGTYGEPQLGDIMMFSESNVFEGSDYLRNIIRYDRYGQHDNAFSNYWFGGGDVYKSYGSGYSESPHVVRRWDDGSPAHYVLDSVGTNWPVYDNEFPGSYRDDDTLNFIVRPLKASVSSSYSGGPYNPRGKSLIEYLEDDIGAKHKNLNVWGAGYSIAGNNLRVNVPWGALGSGSPVFTIMIPTELADTVVWQPQVSNVKIESLKWQTGGTSAEIGDRLSAVLTVKQHGTVRSTALIRASVGSMASVNPTSTQVTLDPGETETLTFEVLNLGANQKTMGTLKVTVTDSFVGSVTDSGELGYTLLPKGGENSILTVHTVDKESKMGVSGITVTIQFDSNSKTGVTSNGAVTWDLGSYTGSATIATGSTAVYKSASVTKRISMGQNSVTLQLEKHGEVPPWWEEYWWLLLFVALFVVAYIIWRKRRR